LGVVLTSPPAVLGGPRKTGSKLPVLGEIEDSDDSDYNNCVLINVLVARSHDVITNDELGLDAGAGPNKQADSNDNSDRLQTDSQCQPELLFRSRDGRKATPPPRGQETRPPERDRSEVRPLGHIVQGPAFRATIFDTTLVSVRDLAGF
jgi:hypothetical protein